MIIISSYSGKCDFGDTVEIHGIENILKSNIYIGSNIIPLKIQSEKDLVPYYPRTVGMSASENGVGNFWLSSESYVDRQEHEILEWYQRDAIKYFNKCKRKKVEVNNVAFIREVGEYEEEIKLEILQRVVNKDMSLSDIHRYMNDYYRKQLYDEMIRVGWDEDKAKYWCFKWRKEGEYPI